jgi:hypothetical protein
MNKPLVGVIVGGVVGAFDGLSALFSAPEVAPEIATIVVGSTFKGVIVGLIAGFFARKVRSLALGIAVGLAAGLLFAYLVAMSPDPTTGRHYYWEIMLPGSLAGAIVGYATQRYGPGPKEARRHRLRDEVDDVVVAGGARDAQRVGAALREPRRRDHGSVAVVGGDLADLAAVRRGRRRVAGGWIPPVPAAIAVGDDHDDAGQEREAGLPGELPSLDSPHLLSLLSRRPHPRRLFAAQGEQRACRQRRRRQAASSQRLRTVDPRAAPYRMSNRLRLPKTDDS